MARHGKQKSGWSHTAKTATVIVASVAAVAALCVAVVYSGLLDMVAAVFAPTDATVGTTTTSTTTATTTATPPEPQPVFAVPAEMKGVWLTAGVDYLKNTNQSADTVKAQIDKAFDSMKVWQFNTVLVPLHADKMALYPSALLETVTLKYKDGTAFDPLAYIVECARRDKYYVYGVVDLHVQDKLLGDPCNAEERQAIVTNVKEQIGAHVFDGYFFSDFSYAIGQLDNNADTAAAGKALDALMSSAVKAVREHNRNLYVGLLSTGIWAHKTVDERGSNTDQYYEEKTDGCADTLTWVKEGLFDCVMAQAYTSTSHPTAPFQHILDWWGETVGTVPLYISHSANTIGSYKVGWKLTDQLAKQYLYCKSVAAWKGSTYDSVTALVNDKSGIAETLQKAYAGTLNEDFLYHSLSVTNPSKTTLTTTSSTVKFEGGGDTNFPLTINGEPIALTEHGFFTQTYDLSIGVNTFTFSHKGTTRTYKVTYKQTLLESVSPKENMNVDGGNVFVITATARKGAAVTATLNGQTVKLTPIPDKTDDGGQEQSDFETFSGSLTLPSGKISVSQPLGAVSVQATYNGLSETKQGGTVTVVALPMPTTTTTVTTTAPVGPTTQGQTPILPAGDSNDIVRITSDYAEVFEGGLSDDYSRPYNSPLAKGTWDYLTGKVYNGSYSYYSLASGKRVYMKDAQLAKAGELPLQALKDGSTTLTDSHTVFTYQTTWCVPFYVSAYPQQYYRETQSGTPNYGIERYGQTAEYVEVVFHYITEVPALPDLSQNPLFSKAEWVKGENNVFTLKLTLRKKGGYYGVSYQWDGNVLKLSFLNPANIAQNDPAEKLKGVRILIDPGHGSTTDKPWEAPFNLDYANTLKEKLESLGATVTMTRTTYPVELSLQQRTQMTNNGNYHLFISVHMNGANGKATGATVWYYYEQAFTPSKYIYDKMHAVEITYGVGTTQNGTPRASGTNWGTLWLNRTIHDCPAVLIECAFLDNPKDKEALIDPVYRDKLMQAASEGILAYFTAQGSGT